MPDYHEKADLAPRDIVARSILSEMNKSKAGRVYLDVTFLPKNLITTRFPHIYRFCLDHGLDITRDQIPVAPAAHYMIGGVKTNSWGETNVTGLFAAGEVACTGVHGANRLASNSLLEAIVFSKRIIERSVTKTREKAPAQLEIKDINTNLIRKPVRTVLPAPGLPVLQQLLWDKAGIVRDKEGLNQAAATLAAWQSSLPGPTDLPSYELSNLILAGRLMTEAALIREESRGAHFRSDFPQTSGEWQRHITWKK